MPPRRPHSKSRLGCKQCKQRRVKCDEKGPVCYNCTRRNFDCSFKYSGAPKRPSSLPSEPLGEERGLGYSYSTPPTSWCPESPIYGRFSRTIELELMHQYSTSTYEAFVLGSIDTTRMQLELPQWALHHQFLLDSIFSLTALHIASQRREDASRYGDLAVAYQERALTRFREVLSDPHPDQCPSMFITSAIISIVTFALPQIHPMAKDSGATATLINMSRLLGGTVAIIAIGKDLMGPLAWQAMFPETPRSESTKLDPEVSAVLSSLHCLAAEADARLLAFPNNSGRPVCQDLYSKPVALLQQYSQFIAADPNVVLAWSVACGASFTDRLEDGEPLAQLITLVYAVLMHQIDAQWWANGSARQLVDELSGPVAAQGPEWEGIAEWAVGRVGATVMAGTPVGSTPGSAQTMMTF